MYYIGILKEKLPGFDTHTHTHTHTHTWFSKLTKKNSKYAPRKVSVLSWKPMGLWGFWNARRGNSPSLKNLNNLNHQWFITKSNTHPTTLVQRWSWSECMPFWWWVWQEGHQAPSSKVLEKTLAQNKTSRLPAWMSAWRGMQVFGEESEILWCVVVLCICNLFTRKCLACKVLSLKCKAP